MCDELHEEDIEPLPLPKDWVASVRYAVLNIVGIVRLAMLNCCVKNCELLLPG